jgi:hypothetical protein
MEYVCKYCNNSETVEHDDLYDLRNGLCENCHDVTRTLRDIEGRIYELGCKDVLEEDDFELLSVAKDNIVLILKKFLRTIHSN